MEINKKIIKELRDCLDEFNLNEIEYSFKDTKIKVSKKSSTEILSTSSIPLKQNIQNNENNIIFYMEEMLLLTPYFELFGMKFP